MDAQNSHTDGSEQSFPLHTVKNSAAFVVDSATLFIASCFLCSFKLLNSRNS